MATYEPNRWLTDRREQGPLAYFLSNNVKNARFHLTINL